MLAPPGKRGTVAGWSKTSGAGATGAPERGGNVERQPLPPCSGGVGSSGPGTGNRLGLPWGCPWLVDTGLLVGSQVRYMYVRPPSAEALGRMRRPHTLPAARSWPYSRFPFWMSRAHRVYIHPVPSVCRLGKQDTGPPTRGPRCCRRRVLAQIPAPENPAATMRGQTGCGPQDCPGLWGPQLQRASASGHGGPHSCRKSWGWAVRGFPGAHPPSRASESRVPGGERRPAH